MNAHENTGRSRLTGVVAFGLAVAMPTSALAAPAAAPEAAEATQEASPEPATVSPESRPAPDRDETPPRPGMGDPGLWNALAGNELRLTLSDGALSGKLMGMQGNQLVFARAGDGLIVSVPTSEVLRVHAPLDRPRQRGPLPVDNGGGLISGGGVLLGIGIPATVAGIVMASICGFCTFIYLPLLLPGGAMVGAGSGMLKVGIDRKRAWEQATFGDPVAAAYGPPMQLHGPKLRF